MIDKRIRFGGGGSQDHVGGGGYQGQGDGKGGKAGGEGTGTDGQGGTGGGEGENAGHNYKAGPEQIVGPVATNLDVKEQYAVGTPVTLGKPIAPPDFTKVGPGSTQYDNYIDKLNLQGATYKPPNLPFFVPGSTLIKTLGSFGFDKNKDFFAQNVAGKYGFGYGLKDFQKYMEQRTLGKVGAYGTPFTAEELRNKVGGGDGGNNAGIMTVDNTFSDNGDGDADGDGDVDQTDNFIFRYFDETGESLQAGAGGVEDLMTRIRQRINNIFS